MTPDDLTRAAPPADSVTRSQGDPTTVVGGAAAAAIRELITDTGVSVGSPIPPSSAIDHPPGFVLERELGEGGMGVVYLARQVGLNRPVALKLVKPSAKVDVKALIRFLAEAEVVASIRHPNVVEVYQYGDHQGKPYMALEYCPGGDLTTVTKAEQTRDANWFRTVAELMAKVADGVGAAHAAGVVHRDLKPANVLLAADGTPKVADFGLAKRGLGSDLTNTDAVMGTPAYMSPEQAGGGTKFVGPETDVWALGVMLYELCCGERPIDSLGPPLIALAAVVQAGVPSLRTKIPVVPSDLALITHKCLSRDPRDRYQTAAELAADLHNWLDGRPISARPVGVVEGAVKWARRNKPLAGAVAAAVLALVLGTAVSVWQAVTAESRRWEAETAREREAEQRAKAEANLKLAGRAVDECYEAVAGNKLLQGDRMRAVRKLLYETALPYYREFTRAAPDDPAALAVHARTLDRVVQITQAIGSNKDALVASEELVAARERLAADGDSVAKRELAQALLTRANLLRVVGRTEESIPVLNDVVERFLVVADQTGDDEARLDAARAMRSLGISHRELSRRDESVAACDRAIRLLEGLRAKHPDDRRYTFQMASTHGVIGYTHALLTGRGENGREKAKAAYDAQRDLSRELLAAEPDNPKYATELSSALMNAGILHLRLYDDPVKARELYTEARDIHRRLSTAYPDELGHLTGLAGALGNLANTSEGAEARRYTDEARQAFEKALAIDPDNARVRTHHSLTLLDLGEQHLKDGQRDKALDHFTRALEGMRAVYARDPGDYYNRDYMTHALILQGEALVALGRTAAARRPLEEAVELAEDYLRGQGAGHVKYIGRLSDAYGALAALHQAEKKPADAAAVTRNRLPLCEQLGTSGTRKDHLFAVAEGFAACVPLATTDADKREYAEAAVDALRQAVKHGLKEVKKLTASEALAPVRDRDDVKELVAELAAKPAPTPPKQDE